MIVKDDKPIEVLFLARDNGDTNPAKSFLKHAADACPAYELLLLAHAAIHNLERDKHWFHARTLDDIDGVDNSLGQDHSASMGSETGHAIALSERSIDAVLSHYQHVKVIWTGMVSEPQAQIAKAFADKGVKVYCFWDTFQASTEDKRLFGGDYGGQNFIPRFAEFCTQMFVTNDQIYQVFSQVLPATQQQKLAILPHPCLQGVKDQVIARQHSSSFKSKLFDTLGLDSSKRLLVYCGGYGQVYADQLALFLNAAANLTTDYQVVICLHPSSDGNIEAKQLAASQAFNRSYANIKICKLNDYQYELDDHSLATYETLDLLSYAAVLTTYQSTLLGFFAQIASSLNQAPQIVYFGTDVDQTPAVLEGKALKAHDSATLNEALTATKPRAVVQNAYNPFLIMSAKLFVPAISEPVPLVNQPPVRFLTMTSSNEENVEAKPRYRYRF